MARRRKTEVTDPAHLPVLGTAEVAAVLGWKRTRVAVAYSRGQLPAPLAVLACGPIWRREEIEALVASDNAAVDSPTPAEVAPLPVVTAAAPARKERRHRWEQISLPHGGKGLRLYRGMKYHLQVSPNEEWGGWWAQVWVTDRRTREQDVVWWDSKPDWTEEDAKEAALAGLEAIKLHRRNPRPPQETEPAKRISECGRGYIMDYPSWIMIYNQETDSFPATEATRRRYREAVTTYAIWWEMEGPGRWSGEAFTPAALKAEDVAEFAVAMGVMHWLNTKAANRVVTALGPFWRWAQRWGYIPKGPSPTSAAKLPEPKPRKKRKKSGKRRSGGSRWGTKAIRPGVFKNGNRNSTNQVGVTISGRSSLDAGDPAPRPPETGAAPQKSPSVGGRSGFRLPGGTAPNLQARSSVIRPGADPHSHQTGNLHTLSRTRGPGADHGRGPSELSLDKSRF